MKKESEEKEALLDALVKKAEQLAAVKAASAVAPPLLLPVPRPVVKFPDGSTLVPPSSAQNMPPVPILKPTEHTAVRPSRWGGDSHRSERTVGGQCVIPVPSLC